MEVAVVSATQRLNSKSGVSAAAPDMNMSTSEQAKLGRVKRSSVVLSHSNTNNNSSTVVVTGAVSTANATSANSASVAGKKKRHDPEIENISGTAVAKEVMTSQVKFDLSAGGDGGGDGGGRSCSKSPSPSDSITSSSSSSSAPASDTAATSLALASTSASSSKRAGVANRNMLKTLNTNPSETVNNKHSIKKVNGKISSFRGFGTLSIPFVHVEFCQLNYKLISCSKNNTRTHTHKRRVCFYLRFNSHCT